MFRKLSDWFLCAAITAAVVVVVVASVASGHEYNLGTSTTSYQIGTARQYAIAAPSYAIVETPPVIFASRMDRLLGRELLPLFPRLRPFKRTLLGQRITTHDGGIPSREWYPLDKRDAATRQVNPNAVFPIAVPGGLHFATGWGLESAVHLPAKVHVYEQYMTQGLYKPVKRVRWTYPVGTVFVETLTRNNKAFEVRTMEKLADGKWRFEIPHQDASNFPPGYRPMRAGSACVECHRDAGASKQYGLLWRGDDFVFSFNPAKEHSENAKTFAAPQAIQQVSEISAPECKS